MTYIALLLLLLNVADSQIFEERCLKLFEKQQFSKLIKTCSNNDEKSTRLNLALLSAEFFQKVPYSRINEIFYNGAGGRFLYKSFTKKELLSKYEENAINEYYGQFKQFAELNEPDAELLTAKMFYILEYILKSDDSKIFDNAKYHKMKQEVYIKNLDKYIHVFPEDAEVLFLLGKEGVSYAYSPYKSKIQLYKINNQRYYSYLLKANKLKHPKAQRYIDGIERWKKHMERVKKEVQNNDPVALYEIGTNLYAKKKENKENLDKALLYLTKAAKQNHIRSLKLLTRIYSYDRPNLDGYLQAQNHLVQLKDTDSMLSLGDFYLCNKKTEKAKNLYEQAKALNSPLAQIALDDLKYDGEPSQGCHRR